MARATERAPAVRVVRRAGVLKPSLPTSRGRPRRARYRDLVVETAARALAYLCYARNPEDDGQTTREHLLADANVCAHVGWADAFLKVTRVLRRRTPDLAALVGDFRAAAAATYKLPDDWVDADAASDVARRFADLAAVADAATARGCAGCGLPATTRCGRCRAARYCSAACQRRHYPKHRPRCRPLS